MDKKYLCIILVIVVMVVVVFGGYALYKNTHNTVVNSPNEEIKSTITAGPPGYFLYTDKEDGVSFLYPKNLKLSTDTDKGAIGWDRTTPNVCHFKNRIMLTDTSKEIYYEAGTPSHPQILITIAEASCTPDKNLSTIQKQITDKVTAHDVRPDMSQNIKEAALALVPTVLPGDEREGGTPQDSCKKFAPPQEYPRTDIPLYNCFDGSVVPVTLHIILPFINNDEILTLTYPEGYFNDDMARAIVKNIKYSTDNTKLVGHFSDEKSAKAFADTIPDVERQTSNYFSFHNNVAYVVIRPGGSMAAYDEKNWSRELWKFENGKPGKKLIAGQWAGFLVSDDGKYIAADNTIFDDSGNFLRAIKPEDISPKVQLIDISSWDGHTAWFEGIEDGHRTVYYFAYNFDTDVSASYPVPNFNSGAEFAFNEEAKKIAYSDYPFFYDVESRDEFVAHPPKTTLSVYDLVTKQTETLNSSIGKKFNPVWLDAHTLQYNNPDNGEKVLKRFN